METGYITISKQTYEGEEPFTLFGASKNYDYSIMVVLSALQTYEEIVNSKNGNAIRNAAELAENFLQEDDRVLSELLKKYRDREMELLKQCQDVTFDFTFSRLDIAEYIRLNPAIRNKRIIIKYDSLFTPDSLAEVDKLFGPYADCVVFKLPQNELYITLDELHFTANKVMRTVERIKSFDLSPLEQFMYAYDLVRDRKFKREEVGESLRISRDLTSVLLGDKIVCEGFSNELKCILDHLGFNCILHNYKNMSKKGDGHSRVAVYIEDKKYGIRGIYSADATWGCRKDDDSFLNSYCFFALTKNQFAEIQKRDLVDITFGDFGLDSARVFENYCRQNRSYKCPQKVITDINSVHRLVYGTGLLPKREYINSPFLAFTGQSIDLDSTIKRVYELVELFDNPLPAEILYKVLFEVRKIEYYENPSKYPFDEDTLCNIVANSRWNYELDEDKALLAALGLSNEISYQLTKNHLTEDGLDKKLALVKLTRTLKEVQNTLQH